MFNWIFISCAEQSGDFYAALLAKELKALQCNTPLRGLCGPKSLEAGVENIVESDLPHVMGFTELLSKPLQLKALQKKLIQSIKHKPKLVILIDSGALNLKIAKAAKKMNIPVVYYIPPKVWAWASWRARKIRRYCDFVIPLYEFENIHFKRLNIQTKPISHPLLSMIKPGKNYIPKKIALCPGSRKNEITQCLPIMLEACSRIHKQDNTCEFNLILARPELKMLINQCLLDVPNLKINIIEENPHAVTQACHFTVCVSGTMSFELMLQTIPMIVVYRFSTITAWIVKQLINIPYVSLPNLIANNAVVPELLQNDLNVDNLTTQMEHHLNSPRFIQSTRSILSLIRSQTSQAGAQSPGQAIHQFLNEKI